jgi:LmbE family N-acetylglucosaminyl deacetylase
MFNAETILVVAPHADDCEIGCGGTVARLVEEGNTVYCATICVKWNGALPEGNSGRNWLKEQETASEVLGTRLITFDRPYYNRGLQNNMDSMMDELWNLKERLKPDLVFIPSTFDVHQDHKAVSEAGVRIFKGSTLLGYELFWNHIGLHQTQAYVRLDKRHIDKKIKAIEVFESQTWRPFCDPTITEGHARCRGVQIGAQYAESFEVIRWVNL